MDCREILLTYLGNTGTETYLKFKEVYGNEWLALYKEIREANFT